MKSTTNEFIYFPHSLTLWEKVFAFVFQTHEKTEDERDQQLKANRPLL